MKYLTVKEVEYSAHTLAKKFMTWGEPIPDFDTRFPQKLESCLAMPQQKFSRKNLYKGLVGKAAILFYLMIKNHPFQNGNKRIAVMTLLLFLSKNEKWLSTSPISLYRFARWIAESDPLLKDEVVRAIEKFVSNSLENL